MNDEQTPTSPQAPASPAAPPPAVIPAAPAPGVVVNPAGFDPAAQPAPAPAPAPVAAISETTESTAAGTDDEATSEGSSAGSQILGVLGSAFMVLLNWIVVPAGIVLVLHFFVFQAFHVVGFSMYPTLNDGDYLIISKVGASTSRLGKFVGQSGTYIPKRGDILVFHYPIDPKVDFVKRAVGLPGEHVIVKDGKVTVYNTEHPEGFSPDTTHLVADPVTLGDVDEIVAPGSIFVMGDNRTPNGSYDSREWGDLPSSLIIGHAVLRLLPLNHFKLL